MGETGDFLSRGENVSERVDDAWRGVEAARHVLARLVEKLTPEDIRGQEETAKAAASLNKALGVALVEEGKIEDARRIERGGDGLDLEAARAEVWRRLDCIAKAEREKGVPG
jgi:hypothetical protein